MATGYTEFIENGTVTTAKQFLQLCARHIGVYKEFSDEALSPDLPTTVVKPAVYEQNVTDAKAALDEALHETDWGSKLTAEIASRKTVYDDYKVEYEDLRLVYKTIRVGIQEWEPTELFKDLKVFALEQIDISVKSLTRPEFYYLQYKDVKNLTADEFKEKTIKKLSDALSVAIKANIEADANLEKRAKQLALLKDLLSDM